MLAHLQARASSWSLLPERKNPNDAGLDLKSDAHVVIEPDTKVMLDTGVQVAIPDGYVGLLAARSSLQKKNLILANSLGIIDSGYRGNLKVVLYNFGKEPAVIDMGERFAQLLIVPIALPRVDDVSAMDDEMWEKSSVRSTGGFGSTGTN